VMQQAIKDSWVEIRRVELGAGERAPQVPVDTQQVPLEMRVKGYLTHDASIGDQAEIATATGRRLSGTLVAINPAYGHQFGSPIPELCTIGAELRELLRRRSA
jgi:2-amino-4-ketopentanoate thiolase alpha subunit